MHGVGSTHSNFTLQFLEKIDSLVQLRGFPKIPLIKYARVAQSVEHVYITKREMKISRTAILMILLEGHGVVGSSPTSGKLYMAQ